MTNAVQKVVLTLAQYFIIVLVSKLFRIQLSAPVFNLIVVSGLMVFGLTTACNRLMIKAIKSKKRALFKILLLLQANVCTKDSRGRTPLHHAIEANDEVIITTLLKKPKVQINAMDKKGVSPVMLAISSQQLSLRVKEMFCNHPDFNIFFTGLHSSVPVVPSLLLEIKSRDNTGDRQLEVLLRMKLRAAMEYLSAGEDTARKNMQANGTPPKPGVIQGEVVYIK